MAEQSPISSYIVTLIHGTWGRKSQWMAASSTFRKQLQEHLGGAVTFHEIPWTGAHSHTARQAAVNDLVKHIDRVAKENSHSLHFLIGHSHGGNIALYALRIPGYQAGVSGVVCMNTPFVCVLRRNTVQLLTLMSALASTWVVAVSMIYAIGSFGRTGEAAGWFDAFAAFPWWQKALLALAGYAAIIGYSYLDAAVMMRFMKVVTRVAEWTVARREALIKDIGLPSTAIPVLSIRSAGDEVIGAVAFSTTVANAPFFVLHPWSLVALFGLLFTAHWVGWLPLLVSMFVGREMHELYVKTPAAEIPRTILEYGLSSGLYLIAMVALVLLVVLAVAPVLRMAPLGLGWQHLLNSLFVNLSFTVVPVTGTHTEFLDLDPKVEVQGLFRLSHSRIYGQTDTIKGIADWIKARSAESGSRGHTSTTNG